MENKRVELSEKNSECPVLSKDLKQEVITDNTNRIAEMINPVPKCRFVPKIVDADIKLKIICGRSVVKKYQIDGSVPKHVLDRLNKELNHISDYGFATIFLHYASLIKACELNPSQYWLKGLGASSIVAYLLGISKIDPLSADCPLYYEIFAGLNGDKEPDLDLVVDEIVWERVRKALNGLEGVGEALLVTSIINPSDKEINRIKGKYCIVPKGRENLIPKVKTHEGVENVFAFNWSDIDHIFLSYDILASKLPTMLFKLESICGISPDDRSIREIDVIGELSELMGSKIIKEDKVKWDDILQYHCPKTFSDVVRIISIIKSTGIWERNWKDLLKEGIVSFKDIMANREDLYETLQNKGISKEKAYKITEYIRKGKMHSRNMNKEYEECMNSHGIPAWFVESCKKTQYLCSRACAAEYARTLLGIAYFKKHYPGEYFKIIS